MKKALLEKDPGEKTGGSFRKRPWRKNGGLF